jgi:hypothetical protein
VKPEFAGQIAYQQQSKEPGRIRPERKRKRKTSVEIAVAL